VCAPRVLFNRDRAGEPSAIVAIGTPVEVSDSTSAIARSGRDSGPCTLLGESINCLVHRCANRFPRNLTSREFMAGKPASTARWSEVPPRGASAKQPYASHRPNLVARKQERLKTLLTVFDLTLVCDISG